MTDEGYIKYQCIHAGGPAPEHSAWQDINDLRSDLVKAGLVVDQLQDEAKWKEAAVSTVWPEMADFCGGKDAINAYLKSFGKAEWK